MFLAWFYVIMILRKKQSKGEEMKKPLFENYLNVLRAELVPAMGCTEPIAIAYAAALAKRTLGDMPDRVSIKTSSNIIKNAKGVTVPNTGGLRGIVSAVAIGIVAGDPEQELQVVAHVGEERQKEIEDFLSAVPCEVGYSDRPYLLDIQVELWKGEHRAYVEIAGHHTNVIEIVRDGEVIRKIDYAEDTDDRLNKKSLTVKDIVEFADTVDIEEVIPILKRQIEYNWAIAEEGLRGEWGAKIGRTLLSAYGDSVHTKAKAYAAAGSDARMNGCEKPVIINSGSGNQGMTASLPVIVYARELGVSEEKLYRALVVSNLTTVHLKTGIGALSAYCGATSAGCGAGAGVCYLHGGNADDISHTIVNSIAINSGMICDGAKASCAAKIASAVEAGLLGWQMQRQGTQFYGGDGIITKGVENTIANVGRLARIGMAETDKEILRIIMGDLK